MIDGSYTVDDLPYGEPVKGWCPSCKSEETLNRHAIRSSTFGVAGSVFRCSRCDVTLQLPSVLGRVLRSFLLLFWLVGLGLLFWVALGAASGLLADWREAGLLLWGIMIAMVTSSGAATLAVMRACAPLEQSLHHHEGLPGLDVSPSTR